MAANPPTPAVSERGNIMTARTNFTGIGWGFDCLGSSVQHLLDTKPTAIWPYITRAHGIAWTPEEINHFRQQGAQVILVNQGFRQGPAEAMSGDEFDFETGAWT